MSLKMRLRGLAAVFAFLLVGVAGANAAEATTGGIVYNVSTIHEYIYVSNRNPACNTCTGTQWTISWGGQRSPSGFNVQGFYIRSSCFMESQWGGIYAGGYWHYMSGNNITLKLKAYCG